MYWCFTCKYVCVLCAYLVLWRTEERTECSKTGGIDRWLWAIMWVLELKPISRRVVASDFNHWEIFLSCLCICWVRLYIPFSWAINKTCNLLNSCNVKLWTALVLYKIWSSRHIELSLCTHLYIPTGLWYFGRKYL